MASNRKVMEEAFSSSTFHNTLHNTHENNLESEGMSDHLFSGEKFRYLSQPLHAKGGDDSVFKGIWKENGKEKEVAVRRVKISECTENWKDIVDNHRTGSLNHDNVLKIFGYEEGSDHFRLLSGIIFWNTVE